MASLVTQYCAGNARGVLFLEAGSPASLQKVERELEGLFVFLIRQEFKEIVVEVGCMVR